MKTGPIIPRYLRKALCELQHRQIPPASAGILTVRHDDWCAIWKTGICTCDPEIELPAWPARS